MGNQNTENNVNKHIFSSYFFVYIYISYCSEYKYHKKQKKLWIYLEIWIVGIIFANVSDIYN